MGYRGRFVSKAALVDATNETEIIIENGVTSHFAISCWYPSSPESQHKCDPFDNVIPIYLTAEGYTRIEIVFDDRPSGLEAIGRIDSAEDWVIRLDFSAKLDEAVVEKFINNFTIFAYIEVDDEIVKTDIVCRGQLTVLPGPYKNG